jgi:PilZ domain-containing protein
MESNRRVFSRVEFNSSVLLIYDNQSVEADVEDISLKGALVHTRPTTKIDTGVSCILEINLGSTEVELKIDTEVVYKQDNKLGLEFQNIDLESMTHLRRLVELNMGNSDQVQQELFFLVKKDV